jgi:hypothetical protein
MALHRRHGTDMEAYHVFRHPVEARVDRHGEKDAGGGRSHGKGHGKRQPAGQGAPDRVLRCGIGRDEECTMEGRE